jgi:hypothetical protein
MSNKDIWLAVGAYVLGAAMIAIVVVELAARIG